MVSDFQRKRQTERIKEERGLKKELTKEQVCIALDRIRSEIRSEIDTVRHETGELKIDAVSLLSVNENTFTDKMYELRTKRQKYTKLLEELNDLNIDASIVSCSTLGK